MIGKLDALAKSLRSSEAWKSVFFGGKCSVGCLTHPETNSSSHLPGCAGAQKGTTSLPSIHFSVVSFREV